METMNAEKYNKKMLGLIKKDFIIIKKMIENIDPEIHEIDIKTLATLGVIQNFTSAIIKNIRAVEQFNALEKVVSTMNEDLGFESWEVHAEKKPKKVKNNGLYM